MTSARPRVHRTDEAVHAAQHRAKHHVPGIDGPAPHTIDPQPDNGARITPPARFIPPGALTPPRQDGSKYASDYPGWTPAHKRTTEHRRRRDWCPFTNQYV